MICENFNSFEALLEILTFSILDHTYDLKISEISKLLQIKYHLGPITYLWRDCVTLLCKD